MRLLLDTHLLLWTSGMSKRLTVAARTLLDEPTNELIFSTASIWEIAIKQSLGRENFRVDVARMRQELLDRRYVELPVMGRHAIEVVRLPRLHNDPFDRILVAQAIVEAVTLVTADATVAKYPCPIRLV